MRSMSNSAPILDCPHQMSSIRSLRWHTESTIGYICTVPSNLIHLLHIQRPQDYMPNSVAVQRNGHKELTTKKAFKTLISISSPMQSTSFTSKTNFSVSSATYPILTRSHRNGRQTRTHQKPNRQSPFGPHSPGRSEQRELQSHCPDACSPWLRRQHKIEERDCRDKGHSRVPIPVNLSWRTIHHGIDCKRRV